MQHLEIEVGQSVIIDGHTVTILDIQGEEIFFQIESDSSEFAQDAPEVEVSRIPR